MGLDFIALFDASREVVNTEWLLPKLVANPAFGVDLVDRYRDYWRPKAWAIETSSTGDVSELLGPGGFSIRVLPRTVELYHMMRFNAFRSDVTARDAMRAACLWIADLVGSRRAIYTHEIMPYTGEGLVEIERGLRALIGPPAATFEELRSAKHYGPRAWYIDSFADLRTPHC